MKSALIYGLRFLLTAAMIAWLTTQVDLRGVSAVMAGASPLWLLGGILSYLLSVYCSAWRWQQLPWAVLFFAIGGWSWVIWGVCLRVAVSLTGHWMVGHFAHRDGHQGWRVEGAAVGLWPQCGEQFRLDDRPRHVQRLVQVHPE